MGVSPKHLIRALALGAAIVAVPALASASPEFAVWLDGNTTPGGGGNGILTSLDHHFGTGDYQLVTTAQLDTPGFLNSFKTLIVSRFDSGFGTGLNAAAAANIQAYVGAANSPTQGGVALFTNDASDNFFGSTSGDPFDANLDTLFANAAKFASASGHGYIGEFNGAAMAVTSNANGFTPLNLLPGVAGAIHGIGPEKFVYGVGPIGSGNPIDNGVTFPFTDDDTTTFLTAVTGADPNNIVDIYTDPSANGDPAVLANKAAGVGPVPEPASMALFGTALVGLGLFRRKRKA